jgi:hypothetical protein
MHYHALFTTKEKYLEHCFKDLWNIKSLLEEIGLPFDYSIHMHIYNQGVISFMTHLVHHSRINALSYINTIKHLIGKHILQLV